MKKIMIVISGLSMFFAAVSFMPAADNTTEKAADVKITAPADKTTEKAPDVKTTTAADKTTEKAANVIKITAAENGKTINATTGKKLEISLKGNPTTGFNWQMAELKSKSIKADGKGKYVADKHDPQLVGSGGAFVFKFTAAKPGKATLKFEYLRPWEKDKPPAETFSVDIVVADK